MRKRIIIEGTEEGLDGIVEIIEDRFLATITVETQSAFTASWHKSFGRMGDLEATYLVTKEGRELLEAMEAGKREIHFGEVLGKHSDVSSTVTWKFAPAWETKNLREQKDGVLHVGGRDPYGQSMDDFYDEVMGTAPPDEGTREIYLKWLRRTS